MVGVIMSDTMIVLKMLEEKRITFEEAMQLLSIESADTTPLNSDEQPSIEFNLIFERAEDVGD
jgi:DNA-directed RNA polymerase subunit F